MANSTQGGSSKSKTFVPAGAGFNLDQFKNEVANEIGMSLGRQGSFGQGAQSAAGSYGAAQNTTGSYGAAQNAATGFAGGNSSFGAGSAGQSPADQLSQSTASGGMVAGAPGSSAQTDFEVSSTLGQTSGTAGATQSGSSPAAKVARQRGQSFNSKQ